MQPISRDLNALKMPLLQRWARKAFARRQVTLDGAKFNLASGHIPGGVKRAMWRGDYELEERAILNRIVKPQDRVLEGGAGMGVASMSVANIVGSKNLVSYEASPATYALLQANIELNGQSFKTVNKALAGTAGSVRFDTGSNLLSQSIVSDSASTSQQSELQADALDDVLAEFAPNTLVLDVEGAEYPMLA